jgi:hypothetical protein
VNIIYIYLNYFKKSVFSGQFLVISFQFLVFSGQYLGVSNQYKQQRIDMFLAKKHQSIDIFAIFA